ncbi:hypothetical protein UCDDA912_g07976 [Diaporthe ampelina]|uniref:Thiamine-triphosphatase n=1 Tax=Diaporthe ampelina TaxID=1214573 RepID=A0A0G2HA03_9PEZI|nr:hypothetical protein UCDDA912_g07976 [Diaporthe ampelina]
MMAAFGPARTAQGMSRRFAAGGGTPSIPTYRPAIFRAVSPLARQHASRPSNSRASSSQPRRPVLEVERKFAPTAASILQLGQNSGEPAFGSVVHKGTTCFEDTYYDTPEDTLSKAGVWIRRREGGFGRGARRSTGHGRAGPGNAFWEAKVRLGCDFVNSACREVAGAREISAMLGALVPGSELDARLGPRGGGVREMARFVTERTGYIVDGKFTVVIDVTDFGHTVGEVELERAATEAPCEGEDRALAIAAMDKEIDVFMRRFLWAFPRAKPVGKLTAYFDHKDGRSPHEQS